MNYSVRLIPQARLQHTTFEFALPLCVPMGKISVSLVFLCLAVSVLLISTDQEVQAAAPLPRYGRREEVSYIAVS